MKSEIRLRFLLICSLLMYYLLFILFNPIRATTINQYWVLRNKNEREREYEEGFNKAEKLQPHLVAKSRSNKEVRCGEAVWFLLIGMFFSTKKQQQRFNSHLLAFRIRTKEEKNNCFALSTVILSFGIFFVPISFETILSCCSSNCNKKYSRTR